MLQGFGYTVNVKLNKHFSQVANGLLVSPVSRKATGTQVLRNLGPLKQSSPMFFEFSNPSSVKISEGCVFAFYIVSVGCSILSALIKY